MLCSVTLGVVTVYYFCANHNYVQRFQMLLKCIKESPWCLRILFFFLIGWVIAEGITVDMAGRLMHTGCLWEFQRGLICFTCPEIRNMFLLSLLFIKQQLRFMVFYVHAAFYDKIGIVLLSPGKPGICFKV